MITKLKTTAENAVGIERMRGLGMCSGTAGKWHPECSEFFSGGWKMRDLLTQTNKKCTVPVIFARHYH